MGGTFGGIIWATLQFQSIRNLLTEPSPKQNQKNETWARTLSQILPFLKFLQEDLPIQNQTFFWKVEIILNPQQSFEQIEITIRQKKLTGRRRIILELINTYRYRFPGSQELINVTVTGERPPWIFIGFLIDFYWIFFLN